MSLPNPYIYDPEYYRNYRPYYEPTLAMDHTRPTGSTQYSRANVSLIFDELKMDPGYVTDIHIIFDNGEVLKCSFVDEIPTDRPIKEILVQVSKPEETPPLQAEPSNFLWSTI